jgi:glycerate 2-kinase
VSRSVPLAPEVLRRIFLQAVRECDGAALVRRALRAEGRRVVAGDVAHEVLPGARVIVVGAGKAAAAMAAAAETVLGDLVGGGVVVTKDGHGQATRHVRVLEAAHPVPDRRGVQAAREVRNTLAALEADDLALVLLSGGASALLPLPAPELGLADVQGTTAALLAAGAPITEINCIRRHLSAIAGGRLLAATRARVVVLTLSDVLGDDPAVIGSGPCAADPSTFADALAVVERRRLELTPGVRAHLEAGARGAREESLKPGDPRLARAEHVVLGSFATLRSAAERAARAAGLEVLPLAPPQAGDVAAIAALYAGRARAAPAGALLVGGGEPTVSLPPGAGRGGRSQHLALLLARALRGTGACFLAAGSDGTDGPTDAAGAVVTGATWDEARARGLTPEQAEARFDSHALHEALGTIVRTGPTGTNLLDLHLLAP